MQSVLLNHVCLNPSHSVTAFVTTLQSMKQHGQPHDFMRNAYNGYIQVFGSNNNTNGYVFKFLISEILKHSNAVPFYGDQRKVTFSNVSDAEFDIVLFDPNHPVVLSFTTSLRERWKQPNLKSKNLKQVYPDAESYLITRDPNPRDMVSMKNKINSGKAGSLDDCVHAEETEFTDLVNDLASRTFVSGHGTVIGSWFVP